jgi:hypothetical protein
VWAVVLTSGFKQVFVVRVTALSLPPGFVYCMCDGSELTVCDKGIGTKLRFGELFVKQHRVAAEHGVLLLVVLSYTVTV